MFVDFDPAKEATNLEQHGLSLTIAESFDWTAEFVRLARSVHGESRWQILAMVDEVVYSAIFVIRNARPRVISLRRASRKERKAYGLSKVRRP